MGQLLTHIVCRSFGDDTIREDDVQKRFAGECVNALFWRNVDGLEKNRHVVAMPEGLEPVSDTHGRFWIDLDALIRAEREPLTAEADASPEPVIVSTPGVGATTVPWFVDIDIDANPTEFVEHGFTMPTQVSERRWKLWDGTIVAGKTKALNAHTAGVRARIRELRAEHQTPAAGSDTDT